MNILLLNYEFPPMGGGAANATFNIAQELVALGHSVDVLTSRLKGQASEEVLQGVRVYRVASWRKGIHDCGMRGAYTYVWNASFCLRKLLTSNRYNVCHYFFSLPTGLLSLLPGSHRSIPYIVSLRGSDVPMYDPFNRKLQIFHNLLKPVTRMIWERAAAVIALSNGLRETALQSVPCQKIGVVGNGVEIDLFHPLNVNKSRSGHFRLISVTRLIERKGVQHILLALKELNDPSIQLLVVGTGNYEEELRELADRLQLGEQVTFYGYCPRLNLPELYNSSDAFILPSMAESFGIVFAEAMACELPVIAGRTGGVPDLIKDENGVLVTPGSVEEIKSAILRLKNSPECCTAMGLANRQRVMRHYSWSSVAARYEEIYRSALVRAEPSVVRD